MIIWHLVRSIQFLIFLSLAFMLVSCGGGSENKEDHVSQVVRIQVSPGTVLLTGLNERHQLKAIAYNAAGEEVEINSPISWTSNKSDVIQVNDSGELEALSSVGSAIISATIDNVNSNDVSVFTIQPVANSVFVNDEQIIGEPELVDPTQATGVGTRYKVTLKGSQTVEPGDMLLGNETQPIGGRVVDKSETNGDTVVTLELVPINEMISELKIDESYELTNEDVELAEDLDSLYVMEKNKDGSFRFTPKLGGALSKSVARALSGRETGTPTGTPTNPFHPLECSSSLPTIPLTLNALPISDSLSIDLDLIIQYDSNNEGLQKLALAGEVKGSLKVTPTFDIAIEGKISCDLQLVTLTVPVGGPVALVLGAQIPIGIGFEIGGKISLAQVGAEVSTDAKITAEIGVQKNASGWEMINIAEADVKSDYKVIMPDSENLDAQFRIEPSLKGFIYTKLAMGNRFFRALQFDTFKVSGGLVESASLATVNGQVADLGFAANYKQTLNVNGGLGGDATNIFGLLDINVAAVSLSRNLDLFTSPKLQSANADVSSFNIGDSVNFDIKLNPNTIDYLSLTSSEPYNLDDIIVYRRVDEAGTITASEIARTSATFAQTDFNINWTADFDGSIEDDFYVFTDTKALRIPFTQGLDLPFLDELELGKIAAPTPACVVSDEFAHLTKLEVRGFSESLDDSVRERNNGPSSPIIVNAGSGSGGIQATAQYGNFFVKSEEEHSDISATASDQLLIIPNNAGLIGQPAVLKAQVLFNGNEIDSRFKGRISCVTVSSRALNFDSNESLSAIRESGSYELKCNITLGETIFLNMKAEADGVNADMTLYWEGMTIEDTSGNSIEYNSCSSSGTDYSQGLGS